jgi:RNA polymerase sigma-70 factor (ECF subfamily)
LVRAIAEGDRQAMAVLYARHNVRVYRFILRLTANAATA